MADDPENFESMLITMLITRFKDKEKPQPAEIRKVAVRLASALEVNEADRTRIIERAVKTVESRLATTMNKGISLVNHQAKHDDEWAARRGDIRWKYWDDYKEHLISNSWGPKVVNTLGDVTQNVLGLLKDPKDQSNWGRRGLVIGHVQSGKTANYIGLVSKAADAGYKFIIVIAGIHNNLRKQTQHRVEEGFVGRDSTPDQRGDLVGVGLLNRNRQHPVSLTTTSSDFTKEVAYRLAADLKGFSQPVIVVIKKHVMTLEYLFNWLKEWNVKESNDQIADIPMLMIDDEADHASINTKNKDRDPTRTNKSIRSILNLFRKSCYIGYTATPFANIFINPDTSDKMLGHDLFPSDFIYCLDPPSNYFGPEKVFLDEEASDRILCTINDAEDYIPLSHKKERIVEDLPPSMKQAINAFVIGKTIRILRNQERDHCSMMINASRSVNIQRQIKEHVSLYRKTMARGIRYSHELPETQALKNEHMASLKKTYDDQFSGIHESWGGIQRELSKAIDSIKIRLINNSSDDTLDYKRYAEKKQSLDVIAIGGSSLSRGVTLEGLIISYMYRNTKTYDVLMQMSRWFGYRDTYEDICRLWLSDESQNWYSRITEATEELRQQIKQMRRDGLTPKNFGLYVRSHPDALTVTASNKMRDAEQRTLAINFSGKLEESAIVPSKEKITERNQEVVIELFQTLNRTYSNNLQELPRAYFWKDVSWENIDQFLIKFRFHKQLINKKRAILEYLRKVAEKHPAVDIAFITLTNPKEDSSFMLLDDQRKLFCQTRSVGRLKGGEIRQPSDKEAGYHITSNQRVASRGAESVGLTKDQCREAEAKAKKAQNISDYFYRTVRNKPLLMIHLLTVVHKNKTLGNEELLLNLVPAMSISFPGGNYSEAVECIVNKVWVQQEFGSLDEEDDDDE